ncbi:MAG TPA: dockerin type I domain-containing protein, partial [Clostridia bacterium]|nr:dockerin type I domain-containing protein [Clostridia bacterium]
SIGYYAFTSCSSLASAYFKGNPPTEFGVWVFNNCASGFTIYYLKSLASAWAPNGETTWNGYPIASYNEFVGLKVGDGTAITNTKEVSATYLVSPTNKGAELGTLKFSYSDSLFLSEATKFNYELATASLGAATGTFTNKESEGDKYVRDLLSKLGFADCSVYTQKFDDNHSTDDTCAFAFAVKKLTNGEYLLIAAIRGNGYGPGFGGEWASNFRVVGSSSSVYSYGFKTAADGVYDKLITYIETLNIDKGSLRIWTFGFSRAAAISNLLAARLTASSGIPQSKIYAYTFATPATVLKSKATAYSNIFNIVQQVDIVPRVPLESWSFSRYGKTLYLPCATRTGTSFSEKSTLMEQELSALLEDSSYADQDYRLLAGQERVIDLLLDYIDDAISSPSVYKNKGYQKALVGVIAEDDFTLLDILVALMPGYEAEARAINTYIEELPDYNVAEMCVKTEAMVLMLNKTLGSMGNDDPAKAILNMIVDFLTNYAARMVKNPLSSSNTTFYYDQLVLMIKDIVNQKKTQDSVNSTFLFMQHWPEVYMAWLNSASYASLLDTRSYKRTSIKCPVDVYVYDEDGVLVGRIVDDVVDDSIEECVYCYCDELGEKEIYLPDDGDYRIEIVAREAGELDIVNNYYSVDSELEAVECYIDIQMEESQQFTESFENEEQSCTVMTNGETLEPNATSTGDEVTYYNVTIEATGSGVAAGAGQYMLGETVSLAAVPEDGWEFTGWYDEDGTMLSEEALYTFSAVGDRAFSAVFTESEQTVKPGDVDCSGNVNAEDAATILRYLVGIETLSEQGMANADCDGDTGLNAADASAILRYLVGLLDKLG